MWKSITRLIMFWKTAANRGQEISLTQYYFHHLLGYKNGKEIFSPYSRLIKSEDFLNRRKELKKLRYKLELSQELEKIFDNKLN